MYIKRVENFGRNDLARKFRKLGFTKGVEIGTCQGKFAKILCSRNQNLKLKTVDPFTPVYGDPRTISIGEEGQAEIYKSAKKRLKPYSCEIIKKTSLEAVVDFPYESIDFVYIDGSHEFDYVMTDIIEWAKRVRKGGIVSGHDYCRTHIGVREAIEAYVEAHKIETLYLTSNTTPSWWFVKV